MSEHSFRETLGGQEPSREETRLRRPSPEDAISAWMESRYCESCPLRNTIRSMGLICPAMVLDETASLQGFNTAPVGRVIEQMARNTLLHCIDDVKSSNEPVILLTDEELQNGFNG